METVRLRLVFNDHRHILNKSQKTEGLKRSWLLLKPELETISDLESYLTHIFDLHESCPNGLLLSMDGFILPLFESTCIFKDKDIIRVKKRAGSWADVIENADQENSLEDSEIVGKRSGVELLALEEFVKETGGYQSEPEESKSDSPADTLETPSSGKTISKKRKSSKKLQSAKKRIKCSSPQKEPPVTIKGVENGVHTEPEEGCNRKEVPSEKTSHKKKRSSKKSGKLKTKSSTQVDDKVEKITESMLSEDSQEQENDTKNREVSPDSEGVKKLPSRSARRKKAKRKWLRELANSQKKETIQNILPAKPTRKKSPEPLQTDQNIDNEKEIVPVVVRPGHIRFEPLDEDQVDQRSQDPAEFFQWNGTTSKKKGQKWGKENTSVSRIKDYKDSREDTFEKPNIEEQEHVHDKIDFEKLKPLSGFPKEDDVVAYRVVELSSSWCPELSSFRVGKVSFCDSVSNRVVLVPVPEYPLVSDEKNDYDDDEYDESDTMQVDASLYKDDGSLEIDFPALHDVRIVKRQRSDASTVVTCGWDEAAVTTKDAVPALGLNDDNAGSNPQTLENGGPVNVWEEISQALSEKKSQLSQKDGWNKKEGSSTSSWSYRALRSSALGPTIALLRTGNGASA